MKSNGGGTCYLGAANGNVSITMIPLSTQITQPIMVGGVTSTSTGAERIERAKINCDASSTFISNSGGFATIGNRSGAGCAITINSGVFNSEPVCNLTVESATVQATGVDTTSATALTVYGPSADYDANLICTGPR